MPNYYTFSGLTLTGQRVYQTVYQVPGGTGAALIKSIYCSTHNTGFTGAGVTGDRDVTVRIYDDNSTRTLYIINSGLVPYQSALNVVDGVIVLNSSDFIEAYASTGKCVDILVNVLQMN